MTTTTALTSELEAINTLLDAIGESPINSLEVTGVVDVSTAKAKLDEVSRTVQTVGWHFNTETDYPLTKNQDGQIVLSPNILKVSVPADKNVVQRGTKLYDKTKHTYSFTKSLTGTVVVLLPWEELPQAARHYIMIQAARVFQAHTLGSDTQFKFGELEERDALKSLSEAEGETGDHNMFSGSSSALAVLSR